MHRIFADHSQHWLSPLLLTALLLTILHSPAIAHAQGQEISHTAQSVPNQQAGVKGIRASGVHYENYIRLLVEKYAPQSKQQWESVLAEGARLRQQLAAQKHHGPHDPNHKPHPENNPLLAHKQVFRQFHDAIASQDAGKIREALRALLPVHKELNAQLARQLQKQTAA